ncbi:MAG: DUF3160 domain-containing protein [Deltaproteobacteria bacterium]|nr:DUF3160 domain-containing protein [Deltaproteobacteria bacterium]
MQNLQPVLTLGFLLFRIVSPTASMYILRRPSRLSLGLFLALGVMLWGATAIPALAAPPAELKLPATGPVRFAPVPKEKKNNIAPELKEVKFAAEKAANFKAVTNLLGVKLSAAQKKFLDQNRFLLIPLTATKFNKFNDTVSAQDYDEMLTIFDQIGGYSDPMLRKPENTRLVTPDIVLHAFHKFFENSLKALEKKELGQTLRDFLSAAQQRSVNLKKTFTGDVSRHFETIAAQLTVPLILAENASWNLQKPSFEQVQSRLGPDGSLPKPADVSDTIENAIARIPKYASDLSEEARKKIVDELRLIYEAKTVTASPLFGQYKDDFKTDYTQFTPRSHYGESSALRAYFRTMMYLGRNSYFFGKDNGITDALLVTCVLADPTVLANWRKIMEVTGFYAGEADDIVYPVWRDFLVKTLGAEQLDPRSASDTATIEKIKAGLVELTPPRILADVIINPQISSKTKDDLLRQTKAFRIFGQRFNFDAWILNRLTAGQEKSDAKLPSTPSALFVAAAFGDTLARKFAGQFLQQDSKFSDNDLNSFYLKLDAVVGDLKKVRPEEWFGSLGTAWLKTISTISGEYGKGYPIYMQSKLFGVKQIQTFLGSYTELKHDTLLYAKQSYAELGDGGQEGQLPPVPKGFVEPNLKFWYSIQWLIDYATAGFKKNKFFPKEFEEWGRLTRFKMLVDLYTRLAEKELRGEKLVEDDYEQLRTGTLSFMAEPFDPDEVLEEKDKRSGLIADIHTDAVRQQILYEATARPYIMLVLVGNENSPRLTIGSAFNHYELTGPIITRYTDGDWQKRAYENLNTLPEKNFWYRGLEAR